MTTRFALLLITALAIPAVALAQPGTEADTESRLHFDLEVDPTAYVLAGYSVHAGIGYDRLRVDIGAFAMALPELVHGSKDFDVSFNGFGVKLQYFPFAAQEGFFFGVDSGVVRSLAERKGSSLAERDLQLNAGAHLGYRIELSGGFYATPWIGVGYAFGAEDVRLEGAKLDAMRVTVFPAIHLGYRAL